MPIVGWKEILIQNSYVWKVHVIDGNHWAVCYNIDKWKDMMIEGHIA